MTSVRWTSSQLPQQEMLQKSRMPFAKPLQTRPDSVATEFMESDWDGDEGSEFEDLDDSPRVSVHSSGQPSFTTLSSYDEVQTPRSSRHPAAFPFEFASRKQVQGPRGPHLFRSSMSSSHTIEFQHALSLSPVTPKVRQQTEFQLPITLDLACESPPRRNSEPFAFTAEELDTADLAAWSPEKVAQWMLNAGVELPAAERFVENDINGAILITLKFEDLKELGVPSFGVRTRIWEEIHIMRNMRPVSPDPETPIEDEPSREVRREQRRQAHDDKLSRRPSSRRRNPKPEDIISPLESVSIVGIEQMMPKPHHCKKGENCSKWRRNQRMIEAFKKDHPFVDMDKGGIIMVAGDPGNPETAEALRPNDDVFRPVSDAIPSVVASSDVMGPGDLPPLQYLREASLRALQFRDPQDNVRQFLDFQHQHLVGSSEVPPTPPFELFPPQQQPHHGLRTLPKLSIPGRTSQSPPEPASAICTAEPLTAHPNTPGAVYRFGTPFSEMDVPVTAIPLGPVSRDISQSVPPDMNYRHNVAPPSRTMSRASVRRPSFPVLPALQEHKVSTITPRGPPSPPRPTKRPLQAPPRTQYSWTRPDPTSFERACPPIPKFDPVTGTITTTTAGGSPTLPSCTDTSGNPISYQGLMRKRKTKMLRHEWHDHWFTLRGTRLAMHDKDSAAAAPASSNGANRTLEYIDIDDYAIACSSIASTSKLNAAFKAMSLKRGDASSKADVAAFSFQLIPQDARGGVKLRKRESALPSSAASVLGSINTTSSSGSGSTSSSSQLAGEGTNGTGKTHHFAVKSRDDRIDWMRELMLAKALKQKGEGFEVSVNGNMI